MWIEIRHEGVDLLVEGEYEVGEKSIRKRDGNGYPGTPSCFFIEKILFDDNNVTPIYENLGLMDILEKLILEKA